MYIKKSNKGYKIFHAASDEMIHDKILKTEDDVKRVLINTVLRKTFQEIVKIDKDFLNGYYVNGKPVRSRDITAMEFIITSLRDNNGTAIEKEAVSILKRLRNKTNIKTI